MLRLLQRSSPFVRCSSSYLAGKSNYDFLKRLDINERNCGVFDGREWKANGEMRKSFCPTTGNVIGEVQEGTKEDYERVVRNSLKAYKEWAKVPAPKRGEIIRQIGESLRENLDDLASLVSIEMGKIKNEGIGEVQEFIDIADYATGLSRMFNGKIIPSERENHMLLEMWNPLGPNGLITAFNFPVAVFGWNFSIAAMCGNSCIWKGSETTPLVSVAVTKLLQRVFEKNNIDPAVQTLICGTSEIGEIMTNDRRLPLISFTGSTQVGSKVSAAVNKRFGKCLLELGGNNSAIISTDAHIDMVVPAVFFAAVGTAGQRCTSLRRLLIHESKYEEVLNKLKIAYENVVKNRVGNPLNSNTLIGPLHCDRSVKLFVDAIEEAKRNGGKIEFGGNVIKNNFVEPTIISNLSPTDQLVQRETFAPILYLLKFKSIDEAIQINNNVEAGLSSSLFTTNMQNLHKWLGPFGSDCGIVNVNIPTSGAEIGGAFGGEKATGGGRESGSDSWRSYMRRSTCTINFGKELPLAQGLKFE
ncbi:hypothetical protein SNEBB_001743 [Seison nebaliae]|nr:hypothetical protein SNEBB_001743 [Seison nebaliae]